MRDKKSIVLFDIDYTLFNAQHFRETFFKEISKYIEFEDKNRFFKLLEEVYEQSKYATSYFDPAVFLRMLSQKINSPIKEKSLEKLIMQEKLLEESLYNETLEVMEKLSKNKDLILGIFSWGSIPVQRAKIKILANYLHKEHIYVVEVDKRDVLPDVLEKYKDLKVYLVDDYQEVLSIAKRFHKNLHTVWIKRPETEGENSRKFANFVPDSIINNLSEIIPLVS